MKILMTSDESFTVLNGHAPEVGKRYVLEEAETSTSEQSRAFHALLQEYFKSGCYSWPVDSFESLRDMVKRDLGAGFERFVYWDGEKVADAKAYEDIPEAIRNGKNLHNLCRGRLKSWTDYTKKERSETIDRLIAQMDTSGVNSKKYQEILAGMGATC